MLSKILIAGIVAIGLTASLAGCARSREMGKSARAVFQGGIETTFERTPEQVAQAIDATAAQLKLIRINSKTQPSDGLSETTETFRTAKDWKVEIIYTKLSDRSCDVEVNTGPFGDSDLRAEIYGTLRDKLNAMAAPAAPPAPTATASAAAPTTAAPAAPAASPTATATDSAAAAAPTTAPSSDSASASTDWAGADED